MNASDIQKHLHISHVDLALDHLQSHRPRPPGQVKLLDLALDLLRSHLPPPRGQIKLLDLALDLTFHHLVVKSNSLISSP